MAYYEYRSIGIVFIVIALLYGVIQQIILYLSLVFWWFINPNFYIVMIHLVLGIILMVVETDSEERLKFVKRAYRVGIVFTIIEILGFIYPSPIIVSMGYSYSI